MARVPSVLSGRLGEFVRRTRENAVELQTIGSTSLERQIQSLFGGTQVRNLPPPLQQLIAQDRAMAGGGNAGPLTINNPFTNDELTPDQQKAAANQIAIQQGAHPPFPEVQQPRSQDGTLDAARRASASVQPLVQEGLLSQKDASGTVRSVVLDNVLDADERRRAALDAKALSKQFKDGRLNIQQVAKTAEQLSTQYGRNVLNAVPEWRELTGLEDQFRSQVNEAVEAEASKHSLPVDAFRFDSKSGTVVRNQQWFEIDAYKSKKATEAAKPVIEANRISQKIASERYDATLRLLQKDFSNNVKINPQAATQQFGAGMNAAVAQFEKELSSLQKPGDAAATPAAQPQAAVSVPPSGLPAGVTLFGTFPDPQSAVNANPPPDSYFIGAGSLYRVRLDGQLEPVQ